MSILVGLLPVICWGFGPIIADSVGGDAMHQVLGLTLGQFVTGIILFLIFRPTITFDVFIWTFLGGIIWAAAQLSQFQSFKLMDVSAAMPLSSGLQLLETPLVGVVVWGEWATTNAKIVGFSALIILILGIIMTNYSSNTSTKDKAMRNKGILILILGSFCYTAFNIAPKIPHATGMSNILPQTLGMFIGSILITFLIKVKHHGFRYFIDIHAIKNIPNGLMAGIGTVGYFVSMSVNGVATAFPLTQLNTVVSAIGGVLILHEHKNKKEMIMMIIGLALIIGSAFFIG